VSQGRLEWKVGVFVLVGLALAATLLIKFSRGIPLFTPTYELRLKCRNVGGIKKGAAVHMAGIPVGGVRAAELADNGRYVIMRLRILSQYPVHGDALFLIEQAGFLGDQYVSIVPTSNAAPVLGNGALVQAEEPFNLQEAARAASGILERMDFTVQRINEAVVRLGDTLLSEKNLTNLTSTISTIRTVSEQALETTERLSGLVKANAPGVSTGVSNLVEFSRQLRQVAGDLEQTVTTNRGQFTAAVKSIDSAGVLVNDLLTGLQAGKGLAGSLLQDRQMQQQMTLSISNLSILSSNLARFGLLYKPRAVKPAPAALSSPAAATRP
jgi:phospholipid/cholesterol/gamma-HCH transport system substrate-binding protein